jgi:hypothetical protein
MKLSPKAKAHLYKTAFMYCRGNAEDIGHVLDWAHGRAESTGKRPVDVLAARWLYCPEYDPVDNEVGSLPDLL